MDLKDIYDRLMDILEPEDDMGFISEDSVAFLAEDVNIMIARGFTIAPPHRGRRSARTQTPSDRRSQPKRKMSAWSKYLKTELPKLKKKHPRMSHKAIMNKAAIAWDKSPKNPNKGSRRSRRAKR